jgi:hypothetical protein
MVATRLCHRHTMSALRNNQHVKVERRTSGGTGMVDDGSGGLQWWRTTATRMIGQRTAMKKDERGR